MTLPLPHLYSGKVRDIYAVGDDQLLMVTSDRLSAFDVVLDEPILHKGRVLTAISAFWFEVLGDVAGSHLVSTDVADLPAEVAAADPDLAGRIMLCRKAEMLSIECIVRGYLSGSAWKEYRASGTMHGQALPAGLQESDQLPEPVFTPSTKSDVHDENISFEQAVDLVGEELATQARAISLDLYARGAALARERGIIIADTKFELGLVDGELVLCDEVMTPDSSRFWPVDEWTPGRRRRRASTSSRCATTSRVSTGTRTRRRRRSPPEIVDGHEPAVHRGLRAHHRPLVRGLAGRGLRRLVAPH